MHWKMTFKANVETVKTTEWEPKKRKKGGVYLEKVGKTFSLFVLNLIIKANCIYLFIGQHFNCQIIHTIELARLKTRKLRKFFSYFFSSDFSILVQYSKSKTRKKKTWEKISEVTNVSDVSES